MALSLQTTRARKREYKRAVAKTRRQLAALPVIEPRRWLRPDTVEDWDADVAEILRLLQEIRLLPET